MHWVEQPIFFIDFEGSRAAGVLEYGVATVQGGKVTAAQCRLCCATGEVRAEDAALHGLREDDIAAFAPFSTEFDFFVGLREKGPFAAHFAGVENALIKTVWPYPRTSPDFARPGASAAEWGPWIDTGALYAQLYPGLVSLKLADLIATCRLQTELDALAAAHCPPARRRYHAALYDALAGALLLASLAGEPWLADLSVAQMLALSTLNLVKRDSLQQRELF
ncbi:MAG: 3'-5' exonuclease [Verrucomicrobiota bacterium]|nr:3'-5' exonuclease [Verrucomicrobiota bacterium]